VKKFLGAFCFFVTLHGCGENFFSHTSTTPVPPSQDQACEDFCPICLQEFTDARSIQEEAARKISRFLLKSKRHSTVIPADPKQTSPE